MNWEQKFAAMAALCGIGEAALHMRKPGDWYVSLRGVEIGNGSTLAGVGGNGASPADAVEAAWERITGIKPGEAIIINAMRDTRRCVRWNGFMWADAIDPSADLSPRKDETK